MAYLLMIETEQFGSEYFGPYQTRESVRAAAEKAERAGLDYNIETLSPGREFRVSDYKEIS